MQEQALAVLTNLAHADEKNVELIFKHLSDRKLMLHLGNSLESSHDGVLFQVIYVRLVLIDLNRMFPRYRQPLLSATSRTGGIAIVNTS